MASSKDEFILKWLRSHSPVKEDHDGTTVWRLNPCLVKKSNGDGCCRVVKDRDGVYTFYCHWERVTKTLASPEDLPTK